MNISFCANREELEKRRQDIIDNDFEADLVSNIQETAGYLYFDTCKFDKHLKRYAVVK